MQSSSISIDFNTSNLKKRGSRKRNDVMENEENHSSITKRVRNDKEDEDDVDWSNVSASRMKKRKGITRIGENQIKWCLIIILNDHSHSFLLSYC